MQPYLILMLLLNSLSIKLRHPKLEKCIAICTQFQNSYCKYGVDDLSLVDNKDNFAYDSPKYLNCICSKSSLKWTLFDWCFYDEDFENCFNSSTCDK